MIARAPLGERLWRVRKNHTWIDAQVLEAAGAVEIQFTYDGARLYAGRFPTRALALREADRMLCDLQRAGWSTHW